MNYIHDDQGHDNTIYKLLNGPQGQLWSQALSNEPGPLAQSNDSGARITDSMELIHRQDVLQNQKFTCEFFSWDIAH